MHLKRKTISKLWPISRTGTKYMARPDHNQNNSVSLMIAFRDMLSLVKNKKELKKILNEKKILVNGKIVKETGFPVSLFDSLAIPSVNKYFRATLVDKKLQLVPIGEKEISTGIYKIINKTLLSGKKIQLNLSNGRNIVSSEKAHTGDFVIVDNLKNKIIKTIPLEKDTKIIVIKGKHIGETGKIKEIVKEGQNEVAKIKGKEEFSTNMENLFAEL